MGDVFPTIVYLLCFLTSAACAVLLARNYLRTRMRMPMWSALCFVGLFLNNVGLFIDRIIWVREVDWSMWRNVPAVVGVLLLLYGLVWEAH